MLMKSNHQPKRYPAPDCQHLMDIIQTPLEEDSVQLTSDLKMESDISRILIVDDDPGILILVSKMAKCLGYHATTAHDAVDALFYLRVCPDFPNNLVHEKSRFKQLNN